MSLSHSPQIITNGLVFAYDMANTQKSWKGAPTTNLYGDFGTSASMRPNTVCFTNGYGWVTNGYVDPGAPSPGLYLGKVYKFVSGALSSTWSGNSYGYMFKDIASASGQAYTMSYWAYVSPDCNIDALPASVEITGGYAAVNLPGAYNMSKKGAWQRIGMSSTGTGGNTRWLAYPQRYGVTDGSFTGYFLIGGVAVETGTFATPYAETTRPNTQAIVDLTGNNTITANSLTYNSDGTFGFNGTSNYIDTGINIPNTTNFTLSFFVRPSDTQVQYAGIVGNHSDNFTGIYCQQNNTTLNNYQWGFGNGTVWTPECRFNLVSNTWHHVALVKETSRTVAYVNSAEIAASNSTNVASLGAYNISFGRDYTSGRFFNGSVSTGQIYNRALSAAEVKQNFNALRGRYGI